MSSISDLRPGAIGFGPIGGAVGIGVHAGQLLLSEGFKVGPLTIEHVFVVTRIQPHTIPTPGNEVSEAFAVEAMPSGAREVPIYDRWTPQYAYVQLPEDYPGQSADAAAIARAMIGTPYSWLSYVALAAWKFGRKPPRAQGPGMAKLETWIDRRGSEFWVNSSGLLTPSGPTGYRVALPREAICSVLADQSWALTGKQVMPKGTPHQCVTPGALAAALLEMPGAKWLWPGK